MAHGKSRMPGKRASTVVTNYRTRKKTLRAARPQGTSGTGIPYRTISGGRHRGSFATYKGELTGTSGVGSQTPSGRTYAKPTTKGGKRVAGRIISRKRLRNNSAPHKPRPVQTMHPNFKAMQFKLRQQSFSNKYGVTTYNKDGTVSTIPTAKLPDGAPYNPNVMYEFDGEGGYKEVKMEDE